MVVSKEDELSDSELLEMFEDDLEKDDGFMSGYRERRLEEMKKECVTVSPGLQNLFERDTDHSEH